MSTQFIVTKYLMIHWYIHTLQRHCLPLFTVLAFSFFCAYMDSVLWRAYFVFALFIDWFSFVEILKLEKRMEIRIFSPLFFIDFSIHIEQQNRFDYHSKQYSEAQKKLSRL